MIPSRTRTRLRVLLAFAMVAIGLGHMLAPEPFVRIVPSWLPWPLALVYISGLAEMAGGVGLLIPGLRRAAGLGLVALYVCVFPANINMAINHIQPEGAEIPIWALWARLPFQFLLIALVLWVSKTDSPNPSSPPNRSTGSRK